MGFNPSDRYQDRIESSAKAYNNPYRQDPGQMRAYEALHPNKMILKDSIETSQQRLERHLLAQFRQNHFKLPNGNFMMVVNVGKYMVLAIILPTYYTLYVIPKFLIIKTFPVFAQMFSVFIPFVQKHMNNISAWTADVFGIVAKRLLAMFKFKSSKSKQKREGDNLFQLLAKDLSLKWEHWKQPLMSKINFVKNLHKTVLNLLKKMKNQAQNKILAQYNKIAQFFKNVGLNIHKAIIARPLKMLKNLQNRLKQIPNVLKMPFVALQKMAIKLREKIKERVKEAVKTVTKPFVQLATGIQNIALAIASPLVNFYKEKIVKPFKKGVEAVKKSVQVVQKRMEESAHWVKTQVASQVQMVANVGMGIATFSQKIVNTTLEKMNHYQVKFVDKLRGVYRAVKRMFDPLKGFVQRIMDESKQQAKKQFAKFKKHLETAVKKAKQAGLWTVEQVRLMPSRMYGWMKRFLAWTVRMTKKVLWSIRVGLTWTKIWVNYSIQRLIPS